MLYDLVKNLAESAPFAPLQEGLAKGTRRQWLCGVRGSGKSLAVTGVIHASREVRRSAVHFILSPSQERAETMLADLTAIYGRDNERLEVLLCPSLEALLYEETSPDYQLVRDRMIVLSRLSTLKHAPDTGKMLVVIATPDAMLHRTLPPEVMGSVSRTIRMGDEVPPEELARWLAGMGYAHVSLVEQPGQFSQRGGVFDVYPSTESAPIRLEFFGDEIDSMRPFDTGTQRSQGQMNQVTLFPAREMLINAERLEAAVPAIRAALQARLGDISHEPIRLPGDSGEEEYLSPAERLSSKVEHELQLLEQGAYFNGSEYYLPFLYPEGATLLDYLPENASVVLDELEHIAHAFHRFREGIGQLETSRLNRGSLLPTPQPLYLPLPDGMRQLAAYPEVAISLLPPASDASFTNPPVKSVEVEELESHAPRQATRDPNLLDGALVELAMHSPTNYSIAANQLEPDLQLWQREGFAVVVATHQEHRLSETLTGIGLPVLSDAQARPLEGQPAPTGCILVRRVELTEGIILPDAHIAILTDSELLGWQKQRRSVRRHHTQGQAVSDVTQLTPGDYVVHISHGVGRYIGLVRREVQGTEREYLQVDYAGQDKLFVPVDQLDRVQKYVSLDENAPEVHRLGGTEWERIKRKTRKSTIELAKQLLQVQAIRSHEQGHAFTADTPWQLEMEEGFPWQETPDQLHAVEDVKGDMEQPHPMDRLICGDVGYGKTEVAIRAAFKAVMDGRQVAVLVPTTVLASQHYRTFRERTAAYPVRVELLSRSVPRKEQGRIVDDIVGGAVDIIVGTHRILSKDIKFKNLGLVVIDEEQRFGVKQKEFFKKLQPDVDVITMSATPIPRTLHMALSGLREMSLIATPPEGRMPVRTLALEADDDTLREAILRELDRDGQVFMLHNRVSSIYHVAEHVRQVAPQARVEVAHGQMAEGELDRIMLDFFERKFDVLVCTAIIENGIDLPNVNTIIVDEADKFGLAQLYQMRGRVGRSDRQAYAYLTWKPRKKLTETAQDRIGALKEFASLGAGYKLALRDLEIRGAGNLLGAEQSGVLAAVGYDLYCQMLEDAVRLVKGEDIEPETEVQIDLPLDAFLPDDYVPDLNQRIDLYRRLAAVRQWRFAEELREEMLDRYGKPLPEPVNNLFRLVGIKLHCKETGVAHITTERGAIAVRLTKDRGLSPQAVRRMKLDDYKWREQGYPAPLFLPDRVTVFTHNLDQPTMLSLLEAVIDKLRHIEEEVAKIPPPKPAPIGPNRRRDPMPPYGRW